MALEKGYRTTKDKLNFPDKRLSAQHKICSEYELQTHSKGTTVTLFLAVYFRDKTKNMVVIGPSKIVLPYFNPCVTFGNGERPKLNELKNTHDFGMKTAVHFITSLTTWLLGQTPPPKETKTHRTPTGVKTFSQKNHQGEQRRFKKIR